MSVRPRPVRLIVSDRVIVTIRVSVFMRVIRLGEQHRTMPRIRMAMAAAMLMAMDESSVAVIHTYRTHLWKVPSVPSDTDPEVVSWALPDRATVVLASWKALLPQKLQGRTSGG